MVSASELISQGYVKEGNKYVLKRTQNIIDRRGPRHGTKTVTYPVKEYQLGPSGEVQVYREYSYKGGKARVVLEQTPEQIIKQKWSPSGERVGGTVEREGMETRDLGKEKRRQERIERARQVPQPPLSSWEGMRQLTLRQHPEEIEREKEMEAQAEARGGIWIASRAQLERYGKAQKEYEYATEKTEEIDMGHLGKQKFSKRWLETQTPDQIKISSSQFQTFDETKPVAIEPVTLPSPFRKRTSTSTTEGFVSAASDPSYAWMGYTGDPALRITSEQKKGEVEAKIRTTTTREATEQLDIELTKAKLLYQDDPFKRAWKTTSLKKEKWFTQRRAEAERSRVWSESKGPMLGVASSFAVGSAYGVVSAASTVTSPVKTMGMLGTVLQTTFESPSKALYGAGEVITKTSPQTRAFYTGQLVGSYTAFKVAGKTITKSYDIWRTRGLKKIDPPVSKEVLKYYETKGKTGDMFPSAPTKTHLSYFMHPRKGLRLPSVPKGLEKKGFGFHATGKPLKSTVVSEKYGQVFFSGKGVSVNFLRIPHGYTKPTFMPRFGRPTVYAGYFDKVVPLKAVKELRLPSGGRYYVFPKPTTPGVAYLPLRKTEVEAVLQPGTKMVPVAKRFYFKLGGRRVPIVEQVFTAQKDFSTRPLFISKATPKYQSILPSPYAPVISSYSAAIGSFASAISTVISSPKSSVSKTKPASPLTRVSRVSTPSYLSKSFGRSFIPSDFSYGSSSKGGGPGGSSYTFSERGVSPPALTFDSGVPPPLPFKRRDEDILRRKRKRGKYKKLIGKYKPSVYGLQLFKESGFSIKKAPKVTAGIGLRPVIKESIKVSKRARYF